MDEPQETDLDFVSEPNWSMRFEVWFVKTWPRLHHLVWRYRRHQHVYIRNSWPNETRVLLLRHRANEVER